MAVSVSYWSTHLQFGYCFSRMHAATLSCECSVSVCVCCVAQKASSEEKLSQQQQEFHRLQAEIIHLTELLNAKQKELEAECCHTQQLKEKLSEHQQRELEMKYCQTDVSLEQELHRLQAEIIDVSESLNAREKELEAERCRTQQLSEKLSEHQQRELETKYCQTDVSLEQELHRLQAEIIDVTELLNTKQKELEAEHCHAQQLSQENDKRDDKIVKLEKELEDLNIWAEYMDENYPQVLEMWEEAKQQNKQLKAKLEKSATDCSKLEAELETLRRQNPDSELQRQLTEERLASNALRNKLLKVQDESDYRLEKKNKEIARLEEKNRELQNAARRQQEMANSTYFGQHLPTTAVPAASAKPSAAPPVPEYNDYVEHWCIEEFKAHNRQLEKQLEKQKEDLNTANTKLAQYKKYAMQVKAERDQLKAAATERPFLPTATSEEPVNTAAGETVNQLYECKHH